MKSLEFPEIPGKDGKRMMTDAHVLAIALYNIMKEENYNEEDDLQGFYYQKH